MSRYTWFACMLLAGFCLASMNLASVSLVHGQSTPPKKHDKKNSPPKGTPPSTPTPTPVPSTFPPNVVPPKTTPSNPPPRLPNGPTLKFPTTPVTPINPTPTVPPVATTPAATFVPLQTPQLAVVVPLANSPFGNPNFGPYVGGGYNPGFNGGMIVSPGFTPVNPFAYPTAGSYPSLIGLGFTPPYPSYGMMDSSNYWGPQRANLYANTRQGLSYGMNPNASLIGYGSSYNPYGMYSYGMSPYGVSPNGNPYSYSYPMNYNPMMMANYNPYLLQSMYMSSYPGMDSSALYPGMYGQMPTGGMNGMGQLPAAQNGIFSAMPKTDTTNGMTQPGGAAALFNPAGAVLDPAALKDQ